MSDLTEVKPRRLDTYLFIIIVTIVWDIDSHKSKDFLLNPICILALYGIFSLSVCYIYKVYK